MGNIWEFLYQTLTVSAAALVLLLLKRLMRDKLSPRWQYGVWVVVALRALVPATAARGIIPPLALGVETLRSAVERQLSSALSAEFEPIGLESVFPWLRAAPSSVTDWLFALYIAGVVLTLAWYVLRYAGLRALLRRGSPAGEETARAIASVAEKYGLRPCRAVAVAGAGSAFVCGVFRPVLAVPEGETPDEKVILHELLHLRYKDVLQNVFWCCLRALHWCNPFLRHVFGLIGNDLESLCDQRVLERLEGEERREYGRILLGMANRAYARVPGTSSISNGAPNIARRIEAIARFRLYPAGMALVGVCTAVVLAAALLTGAAADYGRYMSPGSERELTAALAASRLDRCTGVAGALDTYAKALCTNNGAYFAMATPLERQREWYELMLESGSSPGGGSYSAAAPYQGVEGALSAEEPWFINLHRTDGGSYECLIAVRCADCYVLVPVEVSRGDGGYVVGETGARERLYTDNLRSCVALPPLRSARAVCVGGEVEASMHTLLGTGSALLPPDADAVFVSYWRYYEVFYRLGEAEDAQSAALQYVMLDSADAEYEFDDSALDWKENYAGGSGTDGRGWALDSAIDGRSTRCLESRGGTGYLEQRVGEPPEEAGACALRLYLDGVAVDELVLELEAE